jgi:hypothetical protein
VIGWNPITGDGNDVVAGGLVLVAGRFAIAIV